MNSAKENPRPGANGTGTKEHDNDTEHFTGNSPAVLLTNDLTNAGAPLFLLTSWIHEEAVKKLYRSPTGWQRSTTAGSAKALSSWRPGCGLGVLCGVAYDVIDVDPIHGGDASLRDMIAAGLVPTVRHAVRTPSGGWHLYVDTLGVRKRKPFPGIDYQAQGSYVLAPPTKGYEHTPQDSWPTLGTPGGAAALRALLGREKESSAPAVPVDDTEFDQLPDGWPRELAQRAVDNAVAWHSKTLEDAADWPIGATDDEGNGWDKLTADAAYELAQLGHAPWAPLDIDEAQARFKEIVPDVIAKDPKCGDKWSYQVGYAADEPRPAPWQADFGPVAEGEFPESPQERSEPPTTKERAEVNQTKLFRERLALLRADQEARRALAAEDAESDGVAVDGGSFLFDQPDKLPALWGEDTDVLWAKGEACMIVGPPGVGKTTLTAQVVRGLLGLQDEVLGLPVEPVGKVLYLAMDRPKQIARALLRTFREDEAEHRQDIAKRLHFWEGPPPRDLAQHDDELLNMAQRVGADVVVVDSLKDAALGLSEDAVGSGYNRARQKVLAAGIDVLELHHQKKTGANGNAPNQLSDVYGSTWITSGAGSVVLLWGKAGDPVVDLIHLKQPMDTVGPFKVVHDNLAGTSAVEDPGDPISMAQQRGRVTVPELAEAVFGDKYTRNDREKARRKLDGLVKRGLLRRLPDEESDRGRPLHVYGLPVPFDAVEEEP